MSYSPAVAGAQSNSAAYTTTTTVYDRNYNRAQPYHPERRNMSKKTDTSLIVYKVLGDEHAEEAIELQISTSFQETLTIGFGIADVPGGTDHQGFSVLLGSIIADGLSIGAFDTKTGKLVGVCFNKLHSKSERDNTTPLEENVEENMKHPATLDLMRFIFKIEGSVDLYELYDAENALEIFYIGVDGRYRRYGIATNLMRTSIELARKLARENGLPEPEIAYGVFTSNYSQALGERFDFEWRHSVRYDEYVCYDGKVASERIGSVHQHCKLGARRI
ncbi:uncharacterized protein LOC106642496 [Copidosoma floridanum]|uniref:uncharacterized protein LOC106642496 n=1 Tax=Copidosoma floridanum TaxID=29053 RepID=UPI0006C9869B|nr:uncharacterized protein LOC106642496 [Copidosoma floridanum]